MNKQPTQNPDADKLLDAVIDEFKNQLVPPYPGAPQVHLSESDMAAPRTSPRQLWSVGLPVLATIAVVVAVAAILFWPTNSNTAFAQVQEALQEIQSIQYTVLSKHDDWQGEPKTFTTHVKIVEPHWSRSETIDGDLVIANWDEGRQLSINHKEKSAKFYELKPDLDFIASRLGFLNTIRNISTQATKRVGETDFDGVPAEEFLIEMGDREYLVTVDSETKLPLQMKYAQDGYEEILTDFIFDQEIDARLFVLDAPEGYEVESHTLRDQPEIAKLITVSPESGIDHLGFGSSVEKVIEHLGEPSSQKNHEHIGPGGEVHASSTVLFNELGLRLFFNSEGLASFSCQSQAHNGPTVHDFAGKTAKGIEIGDTIEDVANAYGEPDFADEQMVHYIRKGIMFYVREGRVGGISISEPLDEALEFKVDPETGSYEVWVGGNDN